MAKDIPGTETYSNGPLQIPEDSDLGNVVFSIMESYMERVATHTHSGADSSKISLNIEKDFTLFTLGVNLFWTDLGNNVHRAQLPTPLGGSVDGNIRRFYYDDGATLVEFFPTVEKIDADDYYVYTDQPLANITVVTL